MSERGAPRGPLDFGDDDHASEDGARREGGDGAAAGRPPTSARPPGASRYGWITGVAALVIIAYILVNTITTTNGPGSRGIPAGERLPAFAAPLATGNLAGDANVARRTGQGASGRVPACAVRDPQALNVCRLGARRPLVLVFLVSDQAPCVDQLDVVQRVQSRFAGVAFAAVDIRGARSTIAGQVRRHHWTFPVAYDHDGAVADLYGVAGCPTIQFAYPGRISMGTALNVLDEAQLAARVRALVTATRARRRGGPAKGA